MLRFRVANTGRIRRHVRSIRYIGLILLAACLAGCGDRGPVTKKVQGTITFSGGLPPATGKITLAPVEVTEPFPRRPARGEFDEKGNFTLTTFDAGDGIIPGRYSVNIQCWREKPTLETRLSANYVPPNFEHEVTIAADADEPVEIAIDVPVIQK
jgi:hypothetical protein